MHICTCKGNRINKPSNKNQQNPKQINKNKHVRQNRYRFVVIATLTVLTLNSASRSLE